MNLNQLKRIYFSSSKEGSTEDHDISSLSKRLMLSPEDCHALIAQGHLEPIEASEDGKKLTFRSEDCDLIRNHVVNSTCDEASKGSPKNAEFAAARAIVNLQRKVDSSITLFQRNSKLIRLASQRQEIRFGVAGLIGDGAEMLMNPFLKKGLIGAGIGAIGGAGKAVIHNAVDSNPQDHQSILGNAVSGGVLGGAAGVASEYLGGLGKAKVPGAAMAPEKATAVQPLLGDMSDPVHSIAVDPSNPNKGTPLFHDGQGGTTTTPPAGYTPPAGGYFGHVEDPSDPTGQTLIAAHHDGNGGFNLGDPQHGFASRRRLTRFGAVRPSLISIDRGAAAGTGEIRGKWPSGPRNGGMGNSGSYSKPPSFQCEEVPSGNVAGSGPRNAAQTPTPSTTDLPGMDAPATPGSSPSYSSGSAGSPFDANDPMGGPAPTPAIGTSWKSRLATRPTQIAGPSYK